MTQNGLKKNSQFQCEFRPFRMPGREIYFVFIILFQLKKREYISFETKTFNISTITINDNNRVAESLPKLESFGIVVLLGSVFFKITV